MEISSQDLGMNVDAYRAGNKIVVVMEDVGHKAYLEMENLKEVIKELRESQQKMAEDRQNLLHTIDQLTRSNAALRMDAERLQKTNRELLVRSTDSQIAAYVEVMPAEHSERLLPRKCDCHQKAAAQ